MSTVQFHCRLSETPPRNVSVERIDEDHANAKRLWHEMGESPFPNAREVEQLQAASQTRREPQPWKSEAGTIHLELDLPPHAVAAIPVEFAPQPSSASVRT